MRRLLFILGLALTLPLHSKETDDAIILRNNASYTVISRDKAIYKEEIEILVTKEGKRFANFSCSVNNGSSKLTSFSGTIKDANGKITKLKKRDLSYSEYSEGLSDSYGTWYYTPDIIHYPATVSYTYEKQYTDAILCYTSFVPMPYGDGVSLKEASYTLTVPSSDWFRYKQFNIGEPEHNQTKEGEVFVWKVKDLPALKYERYSPPLYTRIPLVQFSSIDFSYEKKAGSGKDWVSIGNWILSLTEDRSTPCEALQEKVKELTEGAKDKMEIIRRLYAYLGESTRYVSIQLGLGGLQPIAPDDVYRNKFGDCKALSFFLQTMLKCCGIDSYYTITNMGEDRMSKDFPSLGTSNHVILSVPVEKDTLWIECTNPDVPLGYIHTEIAGNNALIVKKDSSYITRIPRALDSQNILTLNATIDLTAEGSATAYVKEQGFMDFWDNYFPLSKENDYDKANSILSGFSIPRAQIRDICISLDPSATPCCNLSYTLDAATYASRTGNRLFIPANPFTSAGANVTSTKRVNDMYFHTGYHLENSITINIPEGYALESYPHNMEYSNEFGSIKFTCTPLLEQSRVILNFTLTRNSGTFPCSKYTDFRTLIKETDSILDSKLVLVKKE